MAARVILYIHERTGRIGAIAIPETGVNGSATVPGQSPPNLSFKLHNSKLHNVNSTFDPEISLPFLFKKQRKQKTKSSACLLFVASNTSEYLLAGSSSRSQMKRGRWDGVKLP
jgi:hypothetical protein